ncbi:MAG: hypothetical protein HF962_09440 [Sulfurovum sp.]|nr:hypothetical protein [Sulfurovum sp.]
MRSHRLSTILLMFIFWVSGIAAQAQYAYSYIPKKVFATQVFPVTVLANTDTNDSPPSFTFDPQSPTQPISDEPLKDKNAGNTFYTFYFKAGKNDIKIPELSIVDKKGTTKLVSRYVPIQELDSTKEEAFCGLIATSCKIITSQVSEFDAHNNIVSLTIKTTEANPEDIQMPTSIESGIEKITKSESETIIEYYFVIPSSVKSITLSYYNTLKNRFIAKSISTDYKDKPVAAQESLNPTDSSFDKLKKYGLSFLSLFFLWMFWKKKEIFFLVLLSICVIILFTIFTPHEKVCIQEGAALYILPTETSTTGGQIDRELSTDILNKRGDYYKIEYDGGIIGWIKNEDTCKD